VPNSPAQHSRVSKLFFLVFVCYGANIVYGPIWASLAPARDLRLTMGTLFPWWQAILLVKGPFRPLRTHCIALGMGLVLGTPSLGWFGVVCVVECALRTWLHGVGSCQPNPLQRHQRHLSTTTGYRCRSLKVDKPSKAQGGRASPGAASQAGASLLSGMHSCVVSCCVCVCCVARFCLGVSCGQGWLGDVFHPACPSIALRTTGGALTLA